MKTVRIEVAPQPDPQARLLVPCGFDDGYCQPVGLALENVLHQQCRTADFGDQQALELTVADVSAPTAIQYSFAPSSYVLTDTFWCRQKNRFSEASQALVDDVNQAIDTKSTQREQVSQLIELAHSHFNYGHADSRFNDNTDLVPSVCGTTKGSCVDMNTYLLAAANVLNLTVQYVAGYWFHPQKKHTLDMHCWLLFYADGEVIPWDLAHHLKWGVTNIAPGLNPAGGRRVPMTFGRGLRFDSEYGKVAISHFSEPVWVHPDGTVVQAEIVATIDDGAPT